jgi:long-subunit fatty acid transport protein
MKKITKLTFAALALYSSTALVAAEAYTPVSYGVKSRGMGGVGVANVQGAESGFANPALLSFIKGNEVSLGGTYTKQNADISANDGSYSTSLLEDTVSPYICANYHILDNLSIGLGLTDYTLDNHLVADAANFLTVQLQKTRVNIPLSYSMGNFSFGASLVYEKINYDYKIDEEKWGFSDNNYGYELGLAYKFKESDILVAINYKSKIEHSFYDENDRFSINSAAEIGIGASWNIMQTPHKIAIEYKRIDSSEVVMDNLENYTQDQDVFALGYMYDTQQWQIRAGYKYVSDLNDDSFSDAMLDIIMPFNTTSHYTIGGSYQFSESFSGDVAVLYATYHHTTNYYEDGVSTAYTVDSKPISLSLGINYTF